MLEHSSITESSPFFQEMDNFVHIDEKWFVLTQKNNTYYLVRGEEATPLRTVHNKNSILEDAVDAPAVLVVGAPVVDDDVGDRLHALAVERADQGLELHRVAVK